MTQPVDYLACFDDTAVPFARAATGHLALEHAAINGRAVTLYLDTGAGRTVIDLACARELGLPLEEDGRGAGGAGSAAVKSFRTRLASLDVPTIAEEDFPARAIDFSHVNQGLRARGAAPMDGMLGAELLDAREAVIDYKQLRLYLKRSARPRAAA